MKSLRITARCNVFAGFIGPFSERKFKIFFWKTGFSILLNIIFIFNLNAQNKRSDLEIKRQQLLQQMEFTNAHLNQTQQSRSAARDRLEALQNQIETREALINTLHEEIDETDAFIERTEEVLYALNDDIQHLREEYGSMMRKAYRTKMPNSAVLFVLSSNNFREAYKRWQLFRQYDKFRKRQAKLIVETQKSLAAKNEYLVQQKAQKELLAGTNNQQKTMLFTEKQSKDKLIDELKGEEKRLTGELKNQEKQNNKLNSAIERLIIAELETKKEAAEERNRKNREEATRLAREKAKEQKRKPKKGEKTPPEDENTEGVAKSNVEEVLTESSENLALSSDFRSNKGKLPAPAAGTIVRTFGKQQVLDKVTALNNGIDIRTAANAEVRAAFGGTVSIVSSLPGLGNIILMQHGNYYTVYSNLSSTSVKKGDIIFLHQIIGRAGVNPVSDESEVHFEIWLEKTHLNPMNWIAR